VHRRYATRFAGQAADADFLGESLAILAGDLANQFAVELLAASAFPAERRTRALAFYAQITADVCYGQLLDVLSGHWGVITCSMADILTIHRYKTARYTTEGPLHLGAVLAGGDEALLSALSMVAVPLGTAFQVQDDLLGMFGDEAITGKATDSDIREGKQTLLVLTALERATPAQQATLRAILGNTQATEEDIATVREIIESTGSRSFCADLVSNLLDEAEAAVSRVPATPEARELLHAVIHHVRGRQR
jgi:geranylgeranyl diphosphate synthase type I